MNYTELFNLFAADNPEFERILGAAVDKMNAPPKVSNAELKQLMDAYGVTELAAPGAAVLRLDLDKMDRGPKAGSELQAKLGSLFDGLAERGNIVEGRQVTLRLNKTPKP
jgi:hypothetical protein